GLDERHVTGTRQRPSLRADNTCCHAVVESKRGTDRNHPLTDFQVACVPDPDGRQVLRGNAYDGNVALRIDADDFRGVLTAVGQADGYFTCAVHDVRVSQDQTVRTDDEAGALAVHRHLLRRLEWEATEERGERILSAEGVLAAVLSAERIRVLRA